MNFYKEQALELLKTIPANDSRDALESLIHFVTDRSK